MSGSTAGKLPIQLSRLAARFAAWRRSRKQGERIPDSLWKSAAQLAVDYGLNRTATALRLDYYGLKKHVDRHCPESGRATFSTARAAFVELPSSGMLAASECVIELADGSGASMRVHLKGVDVPDPVALARSFWNVD